MGRGRVGRGGVVRAGKAPQCHTLHAQDEIYNEMYGRVGKAAQWGLRVDSAICFAAKPSSTILHFLLKSSGSKDDINE